MKLRLIAVATAALILSAGVAAAQDTSTDKGKLSYAFGFQYGQELQQLTARGEQVDINSLVKGLQDSFAKKQPAVPAAQLGTAYQAFQKREEQRMAEAKSKWDKASSENLSKAAAFLKANAAKPGVKTISSGVQYRVLETGTGAKPTQASTVQLEVAGPYPFGERPSPARPPQSMSMKLSEVQMPAMRQALTQMSAGSKWEVTLSPDNAYGSDPRTGIPPNLAVQFEIKLVSVK